MSGWQALADTNLPLLTYKRVKGEEGAKLIPGLAEAMPEVTDDGKTYTLTLRDGLKYSDGTPVKANDFEHTIKRVINLESGGSSFYTGNIVGAEEYEKAGKAKGDISGITADDATRKITIKIKQASGSVPVHPRDGLRRPRAGRHAVREPDEEPAPGRRPVQDHVGPDRSRLRDGEERELPRDRGSAGWRSWTRSRSTRSRRTPRAITDVLQNKVDYYDEPPSQRRPARVPRQGSGPLPRRGHELDVLLLPERRG